jgi:hypothetical protein
MFSASAIQSSAACLTRAISVECLNRTEKRAQFPFSIGHLSAALFASNRDHDVMIYRGL